MTDNEATRSPIRHEEAQALLARYMEIQRRDGNAAEIYPDVAAHIDTCQACQLTLSIAMMDIPGYDAPPTAQMRAADLPFIRSRKSGAHTIRPGSDETNFSIQISFPFNALKDTATQVARAGSESTSVLEVPDSGLLLGKHSFTFEGRVLGVALTLYRDPLAERADSYFILADLIGTMPPIQADARLMIGAHTYTAPIVDNEIEFSDIDVKDDWEQLVLLLES